MALEDSSYPALRQVSDVGTLRALAHPVRLALIEALSLHGPATATRAGELIGESPTTCSFHLRQLAKYGVVEEAGGGKGRERPWKMVSLGMTIPTTGDAETDLAGEAVGRMVFERALARYQEWLQARAHYPEAWRRAADNSEHVFFVTAEELKQLNEELFAFLLPHFRERLTDADARPRGAIPVEMLVLTYPIGPPPEES